MSHVIRLATRTDQPDVEAIVQAAYAPYVSRIGRKPGPMLDDYASLIGEGRIHVITVCGTIEGVLVLVPETGTMLLDNVAVAPAAQGKGFGRLLLVFAEAQAVAAGYGAIRLYTNEAMTENVALYTRLGYVETHRAEEKGLKRVYMTKMLPLMGR